MPSQDRAAVIREWSRRNPVMATAYVLGGVALLAAVSSLSPSKTTPTSTPIEVSPVPVQATSAPAPGPPPKTTMADPVQDPPRSAEDRLWRTITTDAAYGCKDDKLEDRIGELMAQDDERAWKRLLLVSLANGSCRRWYKGDRVYMDEVGFLRHCLRPSGRTECYWTIREAVSRE